MTEAYKIVYRAGDGELVEKKSRFMASIKPIVSEEDAVQFIEASRKKYYDASHNCYAYVLGEQSQLQRFSDDGEPGGTAGKPMLEILIANGIHDAAVVVTRYFGGTLLGKGGLVRAYSTALKQAMTSALIITKNKGIKLKVATDYTGLGKLQYIFGLNGIEIIDTIYTERVELQAAVSLKKKDKIIKDIREATNGQVQLLAEETCYFGEAEGQFVLLNE